jgi:hypothetical protein
MLDGEWHLVHKVAVDMAWTQGHRHAAIRVAAYKWAQAHGYKAKTATNGGGAELHVRFIKEAQ